MHAGCLLVMYAHAHVAISMSSRLPYSLSSTRAYGRSVSVHYSALLLAVPFLCAWPAYYRWTPCIRLVVPPCTRPAQLICLLFLHWLVGMPQPQQVHIPRRLTPSDSEVRCNVLRLAEACARQLPRCNSASAVQQCMYGFNC